MINIRENIPLASLTTFKIGGLARYFIEVKSAQDLEDALVFARDNELKIVILGGGSNIVVSDRGFDGLVIVMKNVECEIADETIVCGAGLSLANLVRIAAQNGLSGLEWAVGIPGTVGGAVRGNAGAYGGSISDTIISVEILDMGKIPNIKLQIPNKLQNPNSKNQNQIDCCEFGYRTSIFKKNPNLVIISAKLKLQKGDREEIREKMNKIIKERAGKVVKGLSAGSFFMNPVVTDERLRREFALDAGVESKSETLPAGWIIEHAGLRGKKIGGAMVSEQHGNFIINTGNATAEDIVMLASIIKQRVRKEYNVQLMEEVCYVGF